MDSVKGEIGNDHTPHGHQVIIKVHGNPVTVEGPRLTGIQIKEAAIAQGVAIQLNFVLSEELGNHHTRIIGDSEIVTVHPHSSFLAIANDDNS